MKKTTVTLLHKPRAVITTSIILGVAALILFYGSVGNAPTVTVSPDASTTISSFSDSSTNSYDLAFPKAGRVSSVSVSIGDTVTKGQVLASLDASDALGAVNQAKGALELAKAQYASMNIQYASAKKQQDVLVANAYRTLLSDGLTAVAHKKNTDASAVSVDSGQIPTITGTYTCDKEGSYDISLYPSSVQSGYTFDVTGIENGSGTVTNYTPQPIGTCGLFIQFPVGYISNSVDWEIDIPNTQSSSYTANKNAYDLAVVTRDQVLKQLAANLGQDATGQANIAQASIDAAQGTYEAALAAYQNDLIVAPVDGVVTFVDTHLKQGQSITANKTAISITVK